MTGYLPLHYSWLSAYLTGQKGLRSSALSWLSARWLSRSSALQLAVSPLLYSSWLSRSSALQLAVCPLLHSWLSAYMTGQEDTPPLLYSWLSAYLTGQEGRTSSALQLAVSLPDWPGGAYLLYTTAGYQPT